MNYLDISNFFKESTLGVDTALSIHMKNRSLKLGFTSSNDDNNIIHHFRSFISRNEVYTKLRKAVDDAKMAQEKLNQSASLYNSMLKKPPTVTSLMNTSFLTNTNNNTSNSNGKQSSVVSETATAAKNNITSVFSSIKGSIVPNSTSGSTSKPTNANTGMSSPWTK